MNKKPITITPANATKMKMLILALALASSTAQAAPWNADCVTFWGGKIAVEDRTLDNCPTGHSHWDAAVSGSGTSGSGTAFPNTNNSLNPSRPTTIVTNSGNYLIVPNHSGGAYPAAVLRVSQGK